MVQHDPFKRRRTTRGPASSRALDLRPLSGAMEFPIPTVPHGDPETQEAIRDFLFQAELQELEFGPPRPQDEGLSRALSGQSLEFQDPREAIGRNLRAIRDFAAPVEQNLVRPFGNLLFGQDTTPEQEFASKRQEFAEAAQSVEGRQGQALFSLAGLGRPMTLEEASGPLETAASAVPPLASGAAVAERLAAPAVRSALRNVDPRIQAGEVPSRPRGVTRPSSVQQAARETGPEVGTNAAQELLEETRPAAVRNLPRLLEGGDVTDEFFSGLKLPKVNFDPIGNAPDHIRLRAQMALQAQRNNPNHPLVQRAIDALDQAGKARENLTEAIRQERSQRLGRGIAAAESTADPLEQSRAFFGAQAGEFGASRRVEGLENVFTREDMIELTDMIKSSGALKHPFDIYNADLAFQKLFGSGELPFPYQLRLLERVYGEKFVRSVMRHRRSPFWDTVAEVLNIPRSMLASGEISASLRQGGFFATNRPARWAEAMSAQIQAFASEEAALVVRFLAEENPNFRRYTQRPNGGTRLFLADIGESATLGQREERFMSRFARRLPVVKQSERAYTTFLNHLRFTVMDDMVTDFERAAGRAMQERELDQVAQYVNWATGRGPLPTPDTFNAILNGAFFSPRLNTSRVAMPLTAVPRVGLRDLQMQGLEAIKGDIRIRRTIALDMVRTLATWATIASLAKVAGAEVETDPRSTLWGRIKIGKTTYDPWAGFQQPARLAWQLITSERKSGAGTVAELPRDLFGIANRDILWQFLLTKASPSASIGFEALADEDVLGQPVNWDITARDRSNPLYRHLTFLFVQDVIDAAAEEGILSGFKGLPSALGIGTISFTTIDDVRQEAAQEMGIVSSETGSADIQDIKREDPDVVRTQIDAQPEVEEALMERQEKALQTNDRAALYRREQDRVRSTTKITVSRQAQEFGPVIEDGVIARSGEGFRLNYAERMRSQADELTGLRAGFEDVIDYYDSLQEEESAFLAAYRTYADEVFDENLEDPVTNQFNFDEQERRKAELRATHGDLMIDRVENYIRDDEHPLVKELRADREALTEFWAITENMMRSAEQMEAYREYIEADSQGKLRIRAQNPALDIMLGVSQDMKRMYRLANPDKELLLLKWGYISRAQNPLQDVRQQVSNVGAR